jgi:hypothetical protein
MFKLINMEIELLHRFRLVNWLPGSVVVNVRVRYCGLLNKTMLTGLHR